MKIFALPLFFCINMVAYAGLPSTLDKPIIYSPNVTASDDFKNKCRIDDRISNRLDKTLNPYVQSSNGDNNTHASADARSQIDSRLRVQILYLLGTDTFGGEKAITVRGQLFENGKPVRETIFTRNAWSAGMGAFKDACQFFEKAADAASNELTRWVRNPLYSPARGPTSKEALAAEKQ
jgi:hypothetical protein